MLALIYLAYLPTAAAIQLEVQIKGVSGSVLQNVRGYLSIQKELNNPEVLESRIRHLHELAPVQIKNALQPFGFYKATVVSRLEEVDDRFVAQYRIETGPSIKIVKSEVSVVGEGQQDPEIVAVQSAPELGVGQMFLHAKYEALKLRLQIRARERGYLDARVVQHRVEVTMQPYGASILLQMETGPRYRFGPVSFAQSERVLRDNLLSRYIDVKESEYFSTESLLGLHTRLVDSGYFSLVEVTPQRNLAVGTSIPVQINLQPRPQRLYRFGLGYGTDSGARVSLHHWRLLNASGHVGAADVKTSQYLNSVATSYGIPLRDPMTERLTIEGGFKDEDTESRISRITKVSVSRSDTRGTWREVAGLNYELEDFELGAKGDESQLLYPLLSWTRLRADDPIYARHGSRLQFDLLGASDSLLSDVSFLQTQASAKWIFAVGKHDRIISRWQIGATALDTLQTLPASKRFFAGGDNSIRGYGFEELGPTGSDGKVIGGKYLFVGSAEFEKHIHDKWSAAIFYDTGNAANQRPIALARGAGFGIRWLSLVGPIRIDFAWAVGEPNRPFHLHLVIGPDL